MKDLAGQVELNIEQATHIARAMFKVADAEEGVHELERQMIDSFYLGCCREAGVEPEDLSKNPFDGEAARRALNTPELQDITLHSCLLVGYADGQCSPMERAAIEEIANSLGVDSSRFSSIEKDVQRAMLEHFSNIKVFQDAVHEIGKRLGLSQEEVDEILKSNT